MSLDSSSGGRVYSLNSALRYTMCAWPGQLVQHDASSSLNIVYRYPQKNEWMKTAIDLLLTHISTRRNITTSTYRSSDSSFVCLLHTHLHQPTYLSCFSHSWYSRFLYLQIITVSQANQLPLNNQFVCTNTEHTDRFGPLAWREQIESHNVLLSFSSCGATVNSTEQHDTMKCNPSYGSNMAADARIRLCEQLKIKIGNLTHVFNRKTVLGFKFRSRHNRFKTSPPKIGRVIVKTRVKRKYQQAPNKCSQISWISRKYGPQVPGN